MDKEKLQNMADRLKACRAKLTEVLDENGKLERKVIAVAIEISRLVNEMDSMLHGKE